MEGGAIAVAEAGETWVVTRHNRPVRLAREGALDAVRYDACMTRLSADSEQFVLRDLTLDLCAASVVPAVVTPRSLDLAHLRTALWFHAEAPLERFVTLDTAQRQAARELGLPI